MKQRKWICLSCNRTGVCKCFELLDMAHLLDVTIGPSHHTVSPDCATPKIHFAIDGQVLKWERRRSTETGTSPPNLEASFQPFPLPEVILSLIELYERNVVVISSCMLSPGFRAQALKNAVVAAERAEEMFVYAEIPSSIEELAALPLLSSSKDQTHTVVFVGAGDAWGKWERMLTEQSMFDLLKQSIRFIC